MWAILRSGSPPTTAACSPRTASPAAQLLEESEIADNYLAPALAAIAYETDKPDAPGLDFAGLQIGHLGAIYEALLTIRLNRALEDLAYDARRDVFRATTDGEQPEVTRAQLFYQAEAGGRKAGGVFYTRHEFVRHLLDNSLVPALDEPLRACEEGSEDRPNGGRSPPVRFLGDRSRDGKRALPDRGTGCHDRPVRAVPR